MYTPVLYINYHAHFTAQFFSTKSVDVVHETWEGNQAEGGNTGKKWEDKQEIRNSERERKGDV